MRAWKLLSSKIEGDGDAMEVEFVDRDNSASHFRVTLPAYIWADAFRMDMALHDRDSIIRWYSAELKKLTDKALGL